MNLISRWILSRMKINIDYNNDQSGRIKFFEIVGQAMVIHRVHGGFASQLRWIEDHVI